MKRVELFKIEFKDVKEFNENCIKSGIKPFFITQKKDIYTAVFKIKSAGIDRRVTNLIYTSLYHIFHKNIRNKNFNFNDGKIVFKKEENQYFIDEILEVAFKKEWNKEEILKIAGVESVDFLYNSDFSKRLDEDVKLKKGEYIEYIRPYKWILIKFHGGNPVDLSFLFSYSLEELFREKKEIKKGSIKNENNEDFIDVDTAFKKVEEKYKEFIKNDGFNIIAAPTGIGKTEIYTKYAPKGAVIAVPTHALRQEVYERLIVALDSHIEAIFKKKVRSSVEEEELQAFLKNNSDKFLTIPDIPFISEKFNGKLEEFYNLGDFKSASSMLYFKKEEILQTSAVFRTEAEQQLLDVMDAREEFKTTDKISVITHHRLLHTEEFEQDNIIIDEDILNSIINQGEINIYDLKKLQKYIKNESYSGENEDISDYARRGVVTAIQTFQKAVNEMVDGEIKKSPVVKLTPKFKEYIFTVLKNADVKADISSFLNSDYILKNGGKIQYIFEKNIDHLLGKKILLLSATTSEFLWRKFLEKKGVNLNFFDVGNVKNVGNLIQYNKKSYSRRYLKGEDVQAQFREKAIETRFNEIKKVIGDIPVISYAFLQDDMHLNFKKDYYFGNTAGKDGLKGQDISILGTPIIPLNTYKLWARLFNIHFSDMDFISAKGNNEGGISYQEVYKHGYKFWTFTFTNRELQELMFYHLYDTLLQAIGRSRSIRFNCDVFIFTQIPIPGAIFME